jgi:type I restriction enzyme, S subunit
MRDTIPDSWKSVPLRRLASKIGSGATPRGGERAYKETGIPLIRSMNVHCDGFHADGLAYLDEEQAAALKGVTVQAGDVLLNITGASIGRVTQAPQEMDGARVNQHVCIIRPIKGVEPSFVARYLASPSMQAFIAGENYGVTRQALTKEMIENISFPVPPLEEQRLIIAKLDGLFDHSKSAREELSRIPRLAARYKQAILAAAFRGDLTTDWRIPNDISFDDHWSETTLGDLSIDVRYGTATKCHYEPKDTPVLRIPNVVNGRMDTTDLKYGSFTETEIDKLALRSGDLLVIRSNGSLDLVGRAGLATDEVAGYLYAGYLIRLRLDSQRVDPAFAQLAFEEPSIRQKIENLAKSTSGVNNINSLQLRGLRLPLPPLPEQLEIVRRVDTAFARINQTVAESRRAMSLLDRLDHATLAKAFRGELVEPQRTVDTKKVISQ